MRTKTQGRQAPLANIENDLVCVCFNMNLGDQGETQAGLLVLYSFQPTWSVITFANCVKIQPIEAVD